MCGIVCGSCELVGVRLELVVSCEEVFPVDEVLFAV